jgi:hypothetical protein
VGRRAVVDGLFEAAEYVAKNFLPGAKMAGVFISKRRRRPMAVYLWHGHRLYCVVFKRSVFRSFHSIYRETFEELGLNVPGGPGQSMNVDLLNQAIERGKPSGGCEMVVVMPDGSVYSYPAEGWLNWAVGHRTIRRTMDEASTEASIPVKIMRKWEKPLPPAETPPEMKELRLRLESEGGKQTKLTAFAEGVGK